MFDPKEGWQDVVLILLEGETMESLMEGVAMFEELNANLKDTYTGKDEHG